MKDLLAAYLVGKAIGLLLLVILFVALGLAGCQTAAPPVERLVVQAPTVPDSYLRCRPAPVPPRATRQSEVGRYVADLAEAGQDCRDRLGAVRDMLGEPRP